MEKKIQLSAELLAGLERPSWNRLFMIYDAMKLGNPIKTIQKLTRIDMWFLGANRTNDCFRE